MSEKYEPAALEKLNADAKDSWKALHRVRDPHNLLLAVGLSQLLEKYIHASLQSQHSRQFPTQA